MTKMTTETCKNCFLLALKWHLAKYLHYPENLGPFMLTNYLRRPPFPYSVYLLYALILVLNWYKRPIHLEWFFKTVLEHLRYSYDFIKIAWSSGQIFKSATRLTPRDAELIAKVFVAKDQSLRISLLLCNLNHCLINLLGGTTLLALYTGCSQKNDFLKLPEACLFVVELPGMQLLPVHQEHLVYLEQFHVSDGLDGRLRTGFQQFQKVTFLGHPVLLFLCSLV